MLSWLAALKDTGKVEADGHLEAEVWIKGERLNFLTLTSYLTPRASVASTLYGNK